MLFTMMANTTPEEKYLINQAVSWLQANLPETWKVEAASQTVVSPGQSRPPRVIDAFITLTPPQQGGGINLLVEAKSTFAPRDAERLFSGMVQQLRLLSSNYPILVVTPWLSERAQEILAKEDTNYLDLTGNARVDLTNQP